MLPCYHLVCDVVAMLALIDQEKLLHNNVHS